ncbi:hypothetical protein [Burkholderia multivorans]|uniref:hypothetical protein n=1 Tax=Burkholderia multivorans TaxID=87883 RepID=UPI000CFF4C2E|nr:hypothetical protein [Burkholderia multivorans]PRG34732.1 hypothetical protein C6T62_17660 [Burkholderia multivorans]
MLAYVGIVLAVIAGLFVLVTAFGVFLKRLSDKRQAREARAAFDAKSARLAADVAAAEANKAKADQAVLDALGNPLVGDATRH